MEYSSLPLLLEIGLYGALTPPPPKEEEAAGAAPVSADGQSTGTAPKTGAALSEGRHCNKRAQRGWEGAVRVDGKLGRPGNIFDARKWTAGRTSLFEVGELTV